MKRLLFAASALALLASSAAEARDYRNYYAPRGGLYATTAVPSWWLLDRGPRIVQVPVELQGADDNRPWGAACRTSCLDLREGQPNRLP